MEDAGALPIECDVSKEDNVEKCFKEIIKN